MAKRKPSKKRTSPKPTSAKRTRASAKKKKPASNKRASNKPTATKKRAANKAASNKPATKKPATKKRAANNPVVKKAAVPNRVVQINLLGRVPTADLLDDARLTDVIALDRATEGMVADEVSAEAALEAGDLDRALAIYTHLIDSSSSPIASFLIGRGRALYRAGAHAAAITDFERGLALEPHYPDLYFDKGKAELQVGRLADAEASFTEDIELDPSPISHYNRHLARKALGNHDGALADLDAAIAELPDEPALRVARAVMRHAADDHAGAFEDADAAATLDPADLMHLDLCGRFALLAGDDARAAAVYATAIALADDAGEPPNPKHFEGHALALAGLDRFAEALPYLDRAVALMPGEPTFLCNRGWTLHRLGRSADGLVDLDRAISLDGTYAQALRNRAAIFAAMGDRNRALADYRTLDSLGHDVTDAIARLVSP